MTHTKHTQSTRTTIALGAAAGLALIGGIAFRVDDQPQAQRSRVVAESKAVADWARTQGLVGLSPASLNVAPQSTPDLATRLQSERTAIADWARSQGLSGLSPVSLAPPPG
jgi:hypothetical protein